MNIETERLVLRPLRAEDLAVLTENLPDLEKEFGTVYDATPLEGFYLDILKEQISLTEKAGDDYIYNTFWFVTDREKKIIVGAVCFKGLENNTVEIGYGLGEKYEGCGYMTEAVRKICSFALENKAEKIIAYTDKDNVKSENVLKRCGFEKIGEEEELLWELKR